MPDYTVDLVPDHMVWVESAYLLISHSGVQAIDIVR